ncbi:T9SS type A sorting domain-containing protein [candidate division KSB1 bacterium]|nr:T9SS type A sorting domain-containing protein [candidate division KSB1 bacterium]MBL7094451.1 T9SS type A sorting domain-containing protein [candidate division KSB1 bacterium]
MIQNSRKTEIDSSFQFAAADLSVPLQIYELRKNHKNETTVNNLLDDAFAQIVADNVDSARAIIEYIKMITEVNQETGKIPTQYSLEQNYPNPFNSSTTICYQLPKPGKVNISIYNVAGQLVETLVDENKNTGYFSVIWQATRIGTGMYFCRIEANDFSDVKKIMVMK